MTKALTVKALRALSHISHQMTFVTGYLWLHVVHCVKVLSIYHLILTQVETVQKIVSPQQVAAVCFAGMGVPTQQSRLCSLGVLGLKSKVTRYAPLKCAEPEKPSLFAPTCNFIALSRSYVSGKHVCAHILQ